MAVFILWYLHYPTGELAARAGEINDDRFEPGGATVLSGGENLIKLASAKLVDNERNHDPE
ncbi:MAG TPA: hypothetical protein VFV79_00250 [Saprospiraceae bacterium]|nr:hypothetical protein [Saprospiraceae bacterium]